MKFGNYNACFLLFVFFVFWKFPYAYSKELKAIHHYNFFFDPNVLGDKKDSTRFSNMIVDTLQTKITSLQKSIENFHGKLEILSKNFEALRLQVSPLDSPIHRILVESIMAKNDSLQFLISSNQILYDRLKQEEKNDQACIFKLSQIQKSLEVISAKNDQYKIFISLVVDEILGYEDSMAVFNLSIDPFRDILQAVQIKKWDSRTSFKLKFNPLLKVMYKTELTTTDLTPIEDLFKLYKSNKEFQATHLQLYSHLILLHNWYKRFFKLQTTLIGDLDAAPKTPNSSRKAFFQPKIDHEDYLGFPSLEFAIKSAMNDPNYKYIPVKKFLE